jgi:membrane-associated phospholipid phosphatase
VTPSLHVLRTAPLQRDVRSMLVVAGCGAALLAASWAVLGAVSGGVPGWEASWFHHVNALTDGLRAPLWPVMQLGNFDAWVVVAALSWIVYRRPAPALSVAAAGFGAWLLAKAVKMIADRGRPAVLLSDVVVREHGIHGKGYVSGHTAVAAAIVAALAWWLPRPLLFVAAILVAIVGFARVYYGAHLPLDVVGGAGVGIVCGALAAFTIGTPAVGR